MQKQPFTAEELRKVIADIGRWRSTGDAPPCPKCGTPGLGVTDCSARPHAEWYKLACSGCGLDYMLAVPMGAQGNPL